MLFSEAGAQVSGTVFRDFNYNGIRESTSGSYFEPGVKGIIINAYNSYDQIIASYISKDDGTYVIPISGAFNGTKGSNTGSVNNNIDVRIEFIVPSTGSCMAKKAFDFSSYAGATYGTSVRFLKASRGSATSNLNFALNNPADIIFDNAPFNSTSIFVAGQFVGNPTGGGSAGDEPVFFKFPFSRNGTTPPSGSEILAIASQIGSVFGVAYSKQANRIFTSAYLKRHAGFGPSNGSFSNAPGTIYMIDPTKNYTSNAASYFTSLDQLGYKTHNSSGSPNYGLSNSYNLSSTGIGILQSTAVSFPTSAGERVIGTNVQRGLSNSAFGQSNDPAAFGQIGLMSLGDLEISDDGQYLFVTNLYDSKIYQLKLNDVKNPTSAKVVNSWVLPDPPLRSATSLPGASITYGSETENFYNGYTGFQRPFALKYREGKIYIGSVTTGENTATGFGIVKAVSNTENNSGDCEYTDLWAYVWELDTTNGFSHNPSLQMPLNYFKGIGDNDLDETFKAWTKTTPKRYLKGTSGVEANHAQAMLANIEFDADGSMVLAFRDRFQDQGAKSNKILSGSELMDVAPSGDIVRAFKNPLSCKWELEVNGKEGINSLKSATSGKGSKEGFGDTSNVLSISSVSQATGAKPWVNVGNAKSEDYSKFTFTSALDNTNPHTENLQFKNLSLNIPEALTDATITIEGIEVKITRKSNIAGSIIDSSIRLLKNTRVANDKATATAWDITNGSVTYGGSTDLWGTNWTPAEVNNSNFGVSISANRIANTAIPSIDHVEIAVYYSITVTNTQTTKTNFVAYSNGSNAGEFYYEDGIDKFNGSAVNSGERWMKNTCEGAIAFLPGSEMIISTQINASENNSSGISWMSNITGANTQDYTIRSGTNIGRSGSLGDIEHSGGRTSATFANLEIGNRVWLDNNGDGIQTAGEAGISNVGLILYADFDADQQADGSIIASTTTDNQGEWYFNVSNISDGDPLTSGNQAGFLPNKNYIVQIDASNGQDWDASANGGIGGPRAGQQLFGYKLSRANIIGNGEPDLSDNDAILINSIPQISILTGNEGENNHSFDFGFDNLAQIGDKVWLDSNKDGIQDTGEPGIAGVTVMLYKNGNDGQAGSGDDKLVAATITDAYGNYLFDNLTSTQQNDQVAIDSTSYNLRFMLLPNYQFTITNSPGDNGTNTNSDANKFSGITASYNLTNGESELTADAGFVYNIESFASIGDRVWFDTDADGIQDSGEPGLGNLTVTLYNGSGTSVIATTVTNGTGNFLFSKITPGNYRVGFSLPAGTIFTNNSSGISSTNNSDASTTAGSNFGKTVSFSVSAEEVITYVDAGIKPQQQNSCSAGDRVWYDNNRDGLQDDGEQGIAGVRVVLSRIGHSAITTVTDAYGYFIFNDLAADTLYKMSFIRPSGLKITTPYSGSSGTVDSDADIVRAEAFFFLNDGQKNMSIDCGMYSSIFDNSEIGALGDFVWDDIDRDGIQDSGEPGVAGVTVTLLNSSNAIQGSTSTDKNGAFLFSNLQPGNYILSFSNLPNNYLFAISKIGGNDNFDSDVIPGTSSTGVVTISAGSINNKVDAGIIRGASNHYASIGNKVWYDLPITPGGTNSNGIQDAGETGVSGVNVELLDGTGAAIDPDGAGALQNTATITNSLGEYIFTGLVKGDYKIQFSNIPSGFTITSQNTGSNDNIDSDGGSLSGGKSTTGLVSIASGENNSGVDLGIKPPNATNTLGNKVWFDLNADGIQSGGLEIGVPSVSVSLYNNLGLFITATTTDMNGEYLFAGIADGSYSVGFSNLPDGFGFTTKSTTNNSVGSDADNSSGKTGLVVLGSSNRNDVSLDAGLISNRSALGNFVWIDSDRDGIQDLNEPGVIGATVLLYSNDGTSILGSAITNEYGYYLFTNLYPEPYILGFTTIPDLPFTKNDVNGEDLGTDSDVDPETGKTPSFSLTEGKIYLNLDAGLTIPESSSIGNYVWADSDKDGIQDANEVGVGGVLVSLYNSSDEVIASSLTDGNGFWLMSELPVNVNYYLRLYSNLPGHDYSGTPGNNPAWTKKDQGANGNDALDGGSESAFDSDVIPSGSNAGKTASFSLIPGNHFNNLDAGLINSETSSPTPVTWLKFKALLINESDVLLTWATAAEINNNYFEVERSFDAKAFTKIETVASKSLNGYSSIILNYDQLDFDVKILGYNTLFYRVRQVDFDGKFEYTPIEIIHLNKLNTVKVYPNPADEVLNIMYNPESFNKDMKATVSDISGRILFEDTYFPNRNETVIKEIQIRNLDRGFYIITLSDGINTKVYKFLKK